MKTAVAILLTIAMQAIALSEIPIYLMKEGEAVAVSVSAVEVSKYDIRDTIQKEGE